MTRIHYYKPPSAQHIYHSSVIQTKSKTRAASPGQFNDEYCDYYENLNKGDYIITEVSPSTGILVLSLRDIFEAIEKVFDL